MEEIKNVYLVDSENVGDLWVTHILDMAKKEDEVVVFYTKKSPHMGYDNLCKLLSEGREVKFVKCVEGRNALDFQLVTELGFRIGSDKEETCYIMVTNDTGFDAVVQYWKNAGKDVRRYNAKYCQAQYNQMMAKENQKPEELPLDDVELDAIAKNLDSEVDGGLQEEAVEAEYAKKKTGKNKKRTDAKKTKKIEKLNLENKAQNDANEIPEEKDATETEKKSSKSKREKKEEISAKRKNSEKESMKKTEIDMQPFGTDEDDLEMETASSEAKDNISNLETASSETENHTFDIVVASVENEEKNVALEVASVETEDKPVEKTVSVETEEKNQKRKTKTVEKKEKTLDKKDNAVEKKEKTSTNKVNPDELLKDLVICLGLQNSGDIHNALTVFLGNEGKLVYQKRKGDMKKYVPEMDLSQVEKFTKYCNLLFDLSENKVKCPTGFAEFVLEAEDKRKNLNSFRSALVKKYGKEKGFTYYTLLKPHIKILNRI